MAKAAKSRSAKSKARKSKATASKIRRRVASTAGRARGRRLTAPQIVCVVTPTDPTTSSISAFCNELMGEASNIILQIYSGANSSANLDIAAGYAVAASPAAILACGSMTASNLLKNHDAQCPVVMVGGEVPQGLTAAQLAKLTGFTIAGIVTAQYHKNKLKGHTATDITVLLDFTNDPSKQIWGSLLQPPVLQPPYPTPVPVSIGPNQTMYPLLINDPSSFAGQTITTKCFMVIPNAMYYQRSADIAKMVDASPAVKWIYYPERQYKDASKNGNQNRQVHGHDIPGTFQDAADIVNGVLNGTYSLTPGTPVGSVALPAITAGRTYQDD